MLSGAFWDAVSASFALALPGRLVLVRTHLTAMTSMVPHENLLGDGKEKTC